MKKRRSLLLLVILLFVFLPNVQASTATVTRGDRYYFNPGTGDYTGSSGKYTYAFKLKVNGKDQTAWCAQYNVLAPKTGVSYQSTTMSEKNSLVIGKIVDLVKAKKLETKRTYTYTYAAINRYLHGQFGGSGTLVKEVVNQAANTKFYTSSKLESGALSLKFTSNILSYQSNGTYTGTVKLVANNVYPSGNITYKLSKCTNCELYTDQAMKNKFTSVVVKAGEKNYTKTLYVKANSGVKGGDSITVSIVGSATSTYTYATKWRRSGVQELITVTDKNYPHTTTINAQATVPNLESKTLYFSKLDASGNELSGANVDVTLTVPSTTPISKTCSTSGNVKCNISFLDEVTSVNYSIVETKAPSGYIISDKIEGTWTIGKNEEKCYSHPKGEDTTWTELTGDQKSDCDAKYNTKDVCLDEAGNVLPEMQTLEQCKNITTDSGTTEGETPENPDAGIATATEENEGTTEGDSTGSEETPETENKNQWTQKCYNTVANTIVDDSKCNFEYIKVTSSGNNFFVTMTNNHNTVSFSKRNSKNNDLEGAKLKVCTKEEYEKSQSECTPYETTVGTKMEWTSSSAELTFTGFAIGTYYLIETSPAPGYILNTKPVIFSIDEHGKIKLEDTTNGEIAEDVNGEEKIIVIKDEVNRIKISKLELATAKELPGATITICKTYKNEGTNEYNMLVDNEGDCTVATLADGSSAIWTSIDKVHEIIGLPAGTYYLVEKTAPDGYSTAESILFTLKEDGTLTDKDGNSLADNKLVMYDEKLKDVKTGLLPLYITIGTVIGAVAVGLGAKYYMKKKKN